ncbi:MAG: YqeG family HAD IIIA-type phosphatase [Clostridiales bacterium]|nr:YqeG family HAD IIIA-type phosphatase [Clostridiales bacterium]
MKKRKLLVPDGMYQDIYEINTLLLSSLGKEGVIFDIDNTVAPYEILRPTKEMKDYFESLVNAGIKIAFVSNNKNDRAGIFNEELGFFCVPDASKPSPKGINRCIRHMGLERDKILLVGDQIFTDCIAAHRAKLDFFMVKPIKDKNTLFFKAKRFLERPFISIYRRLKVKNESRT